VKTYSGHYSVAGDPLSDDVVTVTDGAGTRALDPRLDLRNHSPTGFAWGYGGSGPSQLALALCADALGDDDVALGVYQAFKSATVAGWPGDRWQITDDEIAITVAQLRQKAVAL
jgi:hypothetical protein